MPVSPSAFPGAARRRPTPRAGSPGDPPARQANVGSGRTTGASSSLHPARGPRSRIVAMRRWRSAAAAARTREGPPRAVRRFRCRGERARPGVSAAFQRNCNSRERSRGPRESYRPQSALTEPSRRGQVHRMEPGVRRAGAADARDRMDGERARDPDDPRRQGRGDRRGRRAGARRRVRRLPHRPRVLLRRSPDAARFPARARSRDQRHRGGRGRFGHGVDRAARRRSGRDSVRPVCRVPGGSRRHLSRPGLPRKRRRRRIRIACPRPGRGAVRGARPRGSGGQPRGALSRRSRGDRRRGVDAVPGDRQERGSSGSVASAGSESRSPPRGEPP